MNSPVQEELKQSSKVYKKTSVSLMGHRLYVKRATDEELHDINTLLVWAMKAADEKMEERNAKIQEVKEQEAKESLADIVTPPPFFQVPSKQFIV